MSLSATSSGSPATNQNAKPETDNPFYTEFPPSNWGDHFLIIPSHLKSSGESIQQEHEQLKQEVRRMLTVTESASDDLPLSQRLGLIDAVQRLGVGYHFASEIEDELQKLVDQDCTHDQDDLHVTALRFRLLRQHGIRTPCDKFEKFKDCKGNFKESLSLDVQGMLSLYEAAHLAIRGEDVLDEALAFATKNLESILLTDRVSPQEAEEISRALYRPIRKCTPRLAARQFITAYSMDESHNKALLRFAKLDFNILQELHQKELSVLTRWWKTMDVTTKLPFARDRMVELYFWILEIYFEPQYSFARIIVSKIIAVASIIDDTYDNFGNYEELELLTEAIQRWDNEAIDILPESMKLSFTILFVTYKEIEEELAKVGRQFGMYYAKETRKTLSQCYLVEAKWREEGFVPTVEEHLAVSVTSTCYPMLIPSSFLGMGAIATKEAFEWVSNDPKIVRASALICRLMDDIVAPQFEHKRVHVASVVQCYMKQQQGVSEEEVVSLLRKQIVDAWKDINDECLRPIAAPMPLLERVLNFARVMDVMYKEEDYLTGSSPVMNGYVASVLIDPVPL